MSTTIRDFQYDSKDISLLRVSLQRLQSQESTGFYLGLAGSIVTYLAIRYKTPLTKGLSLGLAVCAGVELYNLYTHDARSSYASLAALSNRNASRKLSEMMT